jgi:hypothetical protein
MRRSNAEIYRNVPRGPVKGGSRIVKMRSKFRKINQGSRERKRRKRAKRLKVE